MKSGKLNDNFISISGHRLTKANGDFDEINRILKSNVSNLVVCCNYTLSTGKKQYIIRYIDEEKFSYPITGSEWKPKYSTRKNKIEASLYEWNSPNGIRMTITPSMSWQIWWFVSLSFFRVGPIITIIP